MTAFIYVMSKITYAHIIKYPVLHKHFHTLLINIGWLYLLHTYSEDKE